MAEADGGGVSVVTLGGKGSSYSSSTLYAIASGQARGRIDLSLLSALSSSSSSKKQAPSIKHKISVPEFLSLEEARAFLVVLLNRLLISSSSGIRSVIPELILEKLNSHSRTLDFEEFEVTENEYFVLKDLSASSVGIAAILDHQTAGLSTFLDAAAAFSCVASGADVSAFDILDSGDGHTSKEEVGVASDMKVLLKGCKLTGKVVIESISKIPEVHGSFRKQIKSMHSEVRIKLNSPFKFGNSPSGNAVSTELLKLAKELRVLGKCSLGRVKSNLDSLGSNNLKAALDGALRKECPAELTLNKGYRRVLELDCEEDYDTFAHEVYLLFAVVWKIVAWEAITAFVALEAVELNEKFQTPLVNGENTKPEKKNEKKKKVVYGKGFGDIVQRIKERLQNKGGDDVELSGLLEKWVQTLLAIFNLKDPKFDEFLVEVKKTVESNEKTRLPKIPKGTRDFANEQMAIREKAFSIIKEVFERHGAPAFDTPVFELRETLMGKYGEDSKLIYDLADQGGELLSLRYDLTVPFARYVAMNGLTHFKRYQIAKVYRRDNPSKGRYREFYQCDFDIAGQYIKMGPDAEVIKILSELLDELDIGGYEIKLNHRKLLDGMMEICGVPPEKFRTICSSIDKLDKQSFDQIKIEMVEEKGLAIETAEKIGAFVKERGHPLEMLRKFKQEGSKFLENEGSVDALNDLEILFKALEDAKCVDKVTFDLSLARGLDYYTGVIYEAVCKGAQVGSIAAGGRYDNLIGMFCARKVPAVGLSLGIERVFNIMEQNQKQNQTRATETEVLVSVLAEDDLSLAFKLVSELWDAKIKAEYLVNKRVMKHIDHAKEKRIPWMVIVGERELNEGIVKLKNIEAAKEEVIPRRRMVEEVRRRLNP